MNQKSFKLSSNIDVLLLRDVNDQAQPIAKIYAYWMDKDGCLMINEEIILFENISSAQSFIRDFSEDSAMVWFENNIPEDEE